MIDVSKDEVPIRIVLSQNHLKALGFPSLPTAGAKIHLQAVATVVRSSTEDPNADGDIDSASIVIQFSSLDCKEEDGNPVEVRETKARKLYERHIGGSPEKGEFGAFNRRFGA